MKLDVYLWPNKRMMEPTSDEVAIKLGLRSGAADASNTQYTAFLGFKKL
jgi:hypothetical protein